MSVERREGEAGLKVQGSVREHDEGLRSNFDYGKQHARQAVIFTREDMPLLTYYLAKISRKLSYALRLLAVLTVVAILLAIKAFGVL